VTDEILVKQQSLYPRMQTQDRIKLLYQRYFGPGHIISDRQSCLDYLYNEVDSLDHECSHPLYEEIGNNLIRVNLVPFVKEYPTNNDLEILCDVFIQTANNFKPNMTDFISSLETEIEDKDFLLTYNSQPMHHSKLYNELYKPSYRVIDKSLFISAFNLA
jgi:hypothetical protein